MRKHEKELSLAVELSLLIKQTRKSTDVSSLNARKLALVAKEVSWKWDVLQLRSGDLKFPVSETMAPLTLSIQFLQCRRVSLSWCVVRKITQITQGHQQKKKRRVKQSPHASWEERLSDACTPLWRLGYEEQLKYKLKTLQNVLRDLTICVRERGGQIIDYDGMICPLEEIIPSPVIYGYRNKSTFSVNFGPNGDPKTVGNYVGRERDRSIVCVHVDHLLNIPERHKLVARFYEDFIRQSPLPPCLHFSDGGHWRDVTVRTSSNGDTMAIVNFHSQGLAQEEVRSHLLSLQDFFVHGPGSVCSLTSLYYQESYFGTCQFSPPRLLHGSAYLTERVLGLGLRVSPTAFLQINTPGAELLYTALGKMIENNATNILIDICCGTGVIGLSLAGHFQEVVGVELIDDAVRDARWNMGFNGIENCQFLAGKAEKLLPELLANRNKADDVVAVVNPPRAGLHHRVVRALRNYEGLQKLIFVTCKPEGEPGRNLTELCCSPCPEKKIFGKAFVPQKAVAVDMFPHTTHCELAMLLTR
ncbi:tRNA (uracil-5-)-methyltransferase homolog B [Spea bombifrons]|uniref:tRNA (uracil-5-)-methyltransferase homolog B n=1 Tax=Spea bombifrons TaxID=233779 RepID=UPI00234B2E4B|nr:tRNA (uracil-5-)-methyltransferase homolog B [Spea bombifrons]